MAASSLVRRGGDVPPLHRHHVRRPRIDRLLDDAIRHPFVLVSAPAGAGKTAALHGWATRLAGSVGWYAVDVDDNDPAVFWPSFAAALGLPTAGVGGPRDVIVALPDHGPRRVLVVDDYHLITLPSVHAELAQLLAATPDLLRIVIATRHDPPLPLAKLRADGVLREVRVHDLRFEADEIAALVAASVGLELSPTEAAHLLRRTEGWAVGVQLAALTLADREDRAAFIEEFSGDDRHVADYLREVVLDRVPEELRIFLAETAILDRLSAPLCETVTGRPGAQAMLDELERRNLFLVPLDHRRRWYRYHHLFAEWLRLQPADDAAAGHRRAANWFTEQGFAGDAVRHHVAAGDPERAADVIEAHRWTLVGQARQATLREWIQLLPPAVLGRRARLALVAAWVAYDEGRWSEVERMVTVLSARASAEAGPDPEESLIRAEIELLDAGRLAAQGRLAEAGLGAAAGLALVDEEEPRARTGLLLVLGKARLDAGDLDGARLAFVEARRLAPSGRIPIVQLIARAHLAELDLLAGDAVAAEAGCRDALDFARASGMAGHPEVAVAHLTLGRILADAGRPEAARAELEQGEELAARIPYEPRARRAAELRRRLEAASAAGPGVEHPPVPGAHPAADDLRTGPTAGSLAALTRQERALLRLLPSSLTTREIAAELFLSRNTVKTHSRSLYRKLGVQTRHAAIEAARRHHLL